MEKIKKIGTKSGLLFVILILNMLIFPAYAERSAEKTGDAAIVTGSGDFLGIMVVPDGTNDVTVSVYNNTAASGNELIPTFICSGSTDACVVGFEKGENQYNTGIYVDITTSGTVTYMVYYSSH